MTAADDAVQRGARVMGTLRALVGVAMIAAPRLVVRPKDGVPPVGDLVFMVRTIGVRDLALGLGTLAAAASSNPTDSARWVRFGMVSDAIDVVTGASSGGLLGRRGAAAAALIPAPFVAADLWVLCSGEGRPGQRAGARGTVGA